MLLTIAGCRRVKCAIKGAGINTQDAVLEPTQQSNWNHGRSVDLSQCKHWAGFMILNALRRGSPDFGVYPIKNNLSFLGISDDPMVFAADIWTRRKVALVAERAQEGLKGCGRFSHPECCESDREEAQDLFFYPEFGKPEGDVKYLIQKNDLVNEWFSVDQYGIAEKFRTDKLMDGKPRHLHFVMTCEELERLQHELEDLEQIAKVCLHKELQSVDVYVITHRHAHKVPLVNAVPCIVGAKIDCSHTGLVDWLAGFRL